MGLGQESRLRGWMFLYRVDSGEQGKHEWNAASAFWSPTATTIVVHLFSMTLAGLRTRVEWGRIWGSTQYFFLDCNMTFFLASALSVFLFSKSIPIEGTLANY